MKLPYNVVYKVNTNLVSKYGLPLSTFTGFGYTQERLWGKEPITENERLPSAPGSHSMEAKTQSPKLPPNLHGLTTVPHACA